MATPTRCVRVLDGGEREALVTQWIECMFPVFYKHLIILTVCCSWRSLQELKHDYRHVTDQIFIS